MNMETIEIILLMELISFQAYLYTITLFAIFSNFCTITHFYTFYVSTVSEKHTP